MKAASRLIFFLLLVGSPLVAQVIRWPDVLVTPPEVLVSDSQGLQIGSEQILYEKTLKSSNSLFWESNTPTTYIQQQAQYELSNDANVNTNQLVDFAGILLRKNWPFNSLSTGLVWTPVMIYNSDSASGNIQSTAELGPTLQTSYYGIPISLSGGFAAKVWNENALHPMARSGFDNYQNSPGYFASLETGDIGNHLLFGLPLYASGSLYRRSATDSKVFSYKGTALVAQSMPGADSFFVYYEDAISDGRNAFVGKSSGGELQYVENERRQGRTMRFLAGVRGLEMLGTIPSLVYSHSVYSISYPVNPGLLRDERSRSNALEFMVKTSPALWVDYAGGLRVESEHSDRLYTTDIGRDYLDIDARVLILDIGDFNNYVSHMSHRLAKYAADSIGGEYSFNISRHSKVYPNVYFVGSDTFQNNDDNDRIARHHRLSFRILSQPFSVVNVFGEYFDNLQNYTKSEQSGENYTDILYRLGTVVKLQPFPRCSLSEALTADAQRIRYQFPEMHPNAPPAYSREFSSVLQAGVEMRKQVSIHIGWTEAYSDDGHWYGSEKSGYYGIQRKSRKHGVQLFGRFSLASALRFDIGGEYRNVADLDYDSKSRAYIESPWTTSRIFIPFLSGTGILTNFLYLDIKAQFFMERYKNVQTFKYSDKHNYWDLHTTLALEF